MNADSVKAKLKNFAINSGCTFQEALVYYGLERTIYRISVSPYASHHPRSFSHRGNNSSSLATMRCCSARGGMGTK